MLEFQITTGEGDRAATRTIQIDPKKITLGFLEDIEAAQETGKWRDLFKALGELLSLTRDEYREITVEQFQEMLAAIQAGATEQTTVPL